MPPFAPFLGTAKSADTAPLLFRPRCSKTLQMFRIIKWQNDRKRRTLAVSPSEHSAIVLPVLQSGVAAVFAAVYFRSKNERNTFDRVPYPRGFWYPVRLLLAK